MQERAVQPPSTAPVAPLAVDRAPKTVEGVRVALAGAGDLRAGRESALSFRLEDPATGESITTLQPYLGEPAHVVVIGEGTTDFAHVHGEAAGAAGAGGHGSSTNKPAASGPEISFHHTFARAGLFKIWGQFKTADGRVITADFVVEAK